MKHETFGNAGGGGVLPEAAQVRGGYVQQKSRAVIAWRAVSDKHLLEEVHRCDRPAMPSDRLPRGAVLSNHVVHSSAETTSLPLHLMCSSSQQAAWYSPGVENYPVQFGDLNFQPEGLHFGQVDDMDQVQM